MQAEPDFTSDNRPNTGDYAEYGTMPFDRMTFLRPAPDDTIDNLPKNISDNAEWWYDQNAQSKRGKNRRYAGHVHRIGGSAGRKIRADLAATIRDLLEWAKDQRHDAASASEKESRQDGRADDQPQ